MTSILNEVTLAKKLNNLRKKIKKEKKSKYERSLTVYEVSYIKNKRGTKNEKGEIITDQMLADELQVNKQTVWAWAKRIAKAGKKVGCAPRGRSKINLDLI